MRAKEGMRMTLDEDSAKTDNRLFRYRSYLPLLFVAVLIPGLREFDYPKKVKNFH